MREDHHCHPSNDAANERDPIPVDENARRLSSLELSVPLEWVCARSGMAGLLAVIMNFSGVAESRNWPSKLKCGKDAERSEARNLRPSPPQPADWPKVENRSTDLDPAYNVSRLLYGFAIFGSVAI